MLISYWTAFLTYILHDPTSKITKASYMNKQFIINVEKRFSKFRWHTTSKYKVFTDSIEI